MAEDSLPKEKAIMQIYTPLQTAMRAILWTERSLYLWHGNALKTVMICRNGEADKVNLTVGEVQST